MMSHPCVCLREYNNKMQSTILSSQPGHSQLRRLVTLRNLAIAAQVLTLAAVWKFLELKLNWQPMLLTIAALAVINLFSWLKLHGENPVSNPELFAQLSVDVVALTVLLFYSGGSTNPFISLYLLPLVIAATTLPPRYTWGMAALTTLCYTFLMKFYVPLPIADEQFPAESGMHDMGEFSHDMAGIAQDNIFNLHVLGMWLGFVFSATIIAWFVVRMAQAVRLRDETLARVREDILRNERIVALGTQAAGAAHEMGTPLSTMAVVIGELQHDGSAGQPELHESLAILDEQVRGCKRILDKILANAQDSGTVTLQSVDALMEELLDEWQLLRPNAQYRFHSSDVKPVPRISADITLRAALMNLLNNAADASPQPIEIIAGWDSAVFTLKIYDRGAGLSKEAALKAGSPYFTTKQDGRGLGLLLANATIERMDGTVRLYNRDEVGAITELTLPVIQESKAGSST